MATLTGLQIDASYLGLFKTTDNAALTGTAKAMTDGNGGASNITMSSTSTNFVSGTVDFTGATVSGLSISAGLENGSGADSLQSAASLTTLPANASGADGIALGDNAQALNNGVSIGVNSTTGQFGGGGVAIGASTNSPNIDTVAIGGGSNAQGSRSVAIGAGANAGGGAGAIAMGWTASGVGGGADSISLGTGATATTTQAIAIGRVAVASATTSVAIGKSATASAVGAVALGEGVTAGLVDTVSMKKLELTETAGSIKMKSPSGTIFTITVDNAGTLIVT